MNINYIAGFFDGEGSIVISNNRVTLSIPQTDEKILLKIKEFFKKGNVYTLKKRKEHWKDAWVYRCNGSFQVLEILLKLEPFLILKKDKALKAIELLKNIQNKNLLKINRNKEAIKLILEQKLSYRTVEKLTGICRQTLCNEMKKIRSIGEKVS